MACHTGLLMLAAPCKTFGYALPSATPTCTVGPPETPTGRTASAPRVRVFSDLSSIGEASWNRLWSQSEVPSVFTRYEWVSAWLQAFRSTSQLRLYVLCEDSEPIGILPLIWPREPRAPVSLVGDDHADYASVLTRAGRTDAFIVLLQAACADLRYGQCLSLKDVREDSPYFGILGAYTRRSLCWMMTAQTPCPRTSLDEARVGALVNKRSLRRHSRKLRSAGKVQIQHYQDADSILERLQYFFEQHIARWASTPYPSLFSKPANRRFYEELARAFDRSGHLIYTELALDGRAVACHFGFISEQDLLWYKPSFDVGFAEISPGEALLQELIRWAGEQRLRGLDFTRGGEPFKYRFADQTRQTTTFTYYRGALPGAIASAAQVVRYAWRRLRLKSIYPCAIASPGLKHDRQANREASRQVANSSCHPTIHDM